MSRYGRDVIRRSKPVRRTGLPLPTFAQVRDYQTRQRAKRKPIPKVGAKTRREKEDLDRFRAMLKARSGGRCEGPLGLVVTEPDGTVRVIVVPHDHEWNRVAGHLGRDPHHLFPEDRDCGLHDPTRGMWLCRPSHNWVDDHPRDAHLVGMLRPEPPSE